MRRIAHISDLHFGRHDPAVAEGLLASLDAHAPHLVVVTGDLTQRARRHQFRAARAFLDRIGRPAVVVPGNHDLPLRNLFVRLLRPRARFERYIGAGRRPRFVDAEIAVVGLNTAWRGPSAQGRVSPGHVGEIRAGFADVGDDVLKVLATHHPLLDSADRPGLAAAYGVRPALEAIAASGVRLLLAGHHHRPYSAESTIDYLAAKRSVLIIQAGTAISTRLRGGPNSFNLIDINGPRVDCTALVWDTEIFRALAPVRFALRGGQWKTVVPAAPPKRASEILTAGRKLGAGLPPSP